MIKRNIQNPRAKCEWFTSNVTSIQSKVHTIISQNYCSVGGCASRFEIKSNRCYPNHGQYYSLRGAKHLWWVFTMTCVILVEPSNKNIPMSKRSHTFEKITVVANQMVKDHMALRGFDFIIKDQSRYAPIQWETPLQCNDVSHWLGAYLDWFLQNVLHKPLYVRAWISNSKQNFTCHVILNLCLNFNGGAVKPPLTLWHEWVLTSHSSIMMWLLIHVITPKLV